MHRRLPVRNSAEDLGGKKEKQGNPKHVEASPECRDGETERDIFTKRIGAKGQN